DVHLLEDRAVVLDAPAGDHLETVEERLGLRALVGLDDADHHVDPLGAPPVRGLQHGVGLPDPGPRADEALEPAPLLLDRRLEECLGRRAARVLGEAAGHARSSYFVPSVSRARLSVRTFTTGSPRMPSCRPLVWRATSAATVASGRPRT